MQQTRRRLLSALGLGVLSGIAGCTGGSGASDDEGSTTNGTSGTDETDAPSARFSGCPSLRENADETVCAATAPADAPVVLRPSASDVESPGTLRFVLSNGTESPLGTNPYDWALHRERESGWERVAPDAVIQPWAEIPPGESRAWELQVGGSHAAPNGTVVAGPLDLEAGTYAFSVVAVGEARTAYVARFRVR